MVVGQSTLTVCSSAPRAVNTYFWIGSPLSSDEVQVTVKAPSPTDTCRGVPGGVGLPFTFKVRRPSTLRSGSLVASITV